MPGTTPVYGFPYPEPTDLVADYPALGQDLAEDIEAVLPTLGALSLVTPTSIANSGGTASSTGGTTTYTGVTSISLNGVFSASAQNYYVTYQNTNTSASIMYMRFRTSGTDNTNSSYNNAIGSVASTLAVQNHSTNANTLNFAYSGNAVGNHGTITIFTPFATAVTGVLMDNLYRQTDPLMVRLYGGGVFNATTSFDGFTMYQASGTLTGTLRVYAIRGA